MRTHSTKYTILPFVFISLFTSCKQLQKMSCQSGLDAPCHASIESTSNANEVAFALELAKTKCNEEKPESCTPLKKVRNKHPFLSACLDKDSNADARHTVQMLLNITSQKDCHLGLEELQRMRDIDLSKKDIVDLSPVAHFENLRYLRASENRISNISELFKLKNLLEVDLTSNEIFSINGMEKMTGLKRIALGGNKIEDATVVTKMPGIEIISLRDNQIRDFSKIQLPSGIKRVNFSSNPIQNRFFVDLNSNPFTAEITKILSEQMKCDSADFASRTTQGGLRYSTKFSEQEATWIADDDSINLFKQDSPKKLTLSAYKVNDGFIGICRNNVLMAISNLTEMAALPSKKDLEMILEVLETIPTKEWASKIDQFADILLPDEYKSTKWTREKLAWLNNSNKEFDTIFYLNRQKYNREKIFALTIIRK